MVPKLILAFFIQIVQDQHVTLCFAYWISFPQGVLLL
jgi:hypothetical protein